MDKKSKILIWVFVVLIIASVGVTFWRIMIKKDYIISAQTDCDPYAEKCFVWECDPESDAEGEACTGDPETDVPWHFQVVNRKAFNIPLCDPNAEDCEALVCSEGEADCTVEFCTEETMADQYATSCNDPVKFTEENPVEEEAVECEEGDTECEAALEEEACDPEGEEECPVAEEGAEVPAEADSAQVVE